MFSRHARTMLLLLALAAALSALPATARATAMTASQASLLKEMNRVRAAHGLRGLAFDPTLSQAALAHSRDMAARGYFAHGDFAQRMLRFKVRGPFVGENLAWGVGSYGTASGVVRAWLASPGHRRNLLRPGFRRVGLGELRAPFQGVSGANVVTADFAGF